MTRSLPPDFDPENPTEVAGGRKFPFHTAGDWVYLAADPEDGKPLKPTAKALYSLLRMHCNRDRGNNLAWPGTEALAEMLGLSRGDKVTPYLKALVRAGAVEVEVYRWGPNNMKRRNLYTVHEAPPLGYPGFASLAEFYAARRAHREELEEANRTLSGKTAGQPGPPEKRGTGDLRTSKKTLPVPPKSGGPEHPESGAPETLFSGGPVPPKTGEQPHQPQNKTKERTDGEEEAARERAQADPPAHEEKPTALPEPSFFALVTIRTILDDAPQIAGRDRDVPELIGEAEVHELASMFEAETERLAVHRPDRAGGDLAAWLGRGLGTADSLYAVLRSRLRPGAATSRIVRPPKHRAPESSDNVPALPKRPATCPNHPDVPLGACAPCAERQEAERARRAAATRHFAEMARQNLAAAAGDDEGA